MEVEIWDPGRAFIVNYSILWVIFGSYWDNGKEMESTILGSMPKSLRVRGICKRDQSISRRLSKPPSGNPTEHPKSIFAGSEFPKPYTLNPKPLNPKRGQTVRLNILQLGEFL